MLSANLDRLDIVPFIQPELKDLLLKVSNLLKTPLEPGRHEIDGGKVFMLLMDAATDVHENRRPEFHENFIDVQILLEGDETLGYGHGAAQEITEDKLAEKDVAFTSSIADEKLIRMAPRDFVVFYPGELHRPQIAPDGKGTTVRKAVLKIHMEILGN